MLGSNRQECTEARKVELDFFWKHRLMVIFLNVQQAVEEKYRLCDETLSKLLEWIAVVEERLANQEAVKEDIDELRNQINILKVRLLKSSFNLKMY